MKLFILAGHQNITKQQIIKVITKAQKELATILRNESDNWDKGLYDLYGGRVCGKRENLTLSLTINWTNLQGIWIIYERKRLFNVKLNEPNNGTERKHKNQIDLPANVSHHHHWNSHLKFSIKHTQEMSLMERNRERQNERQSKKKQWSCSLEILNYWDTRGEYSAATNTEK